jgi:hypothetical protein
MRSSLLRIILPFVIALLCNMANAQSKKLKAYFSTPGKVGIYVKAEINIDAIWLHTNRTGADDQTKSKYYQSLKAIGPKLDIVGQLNKFYKDIYESKGKTVVMIDTLNATLDNFSNVDDKIDLRPLKEKLQVDELLFVHVRYGIRSVIQFGHEISAETKASIRPALIDLDDNSVIMKDRSYVESVLSPSWDTPPAYGNMLYDIQEAFKKAMAEDGKKYKE